MAALSSSSRYVLRAVLVAAASVSFGFLLGPSALQAITPESASAQSESAAFGYDDRGVTHDSYANPTPGPIATTGVVATYELGAHPVTAGREAVSRAVVPAVALDEGLAPSVVSLAELHAPRGLATGADEAVFWSGVQGADSTAASWVGKNGGATLETTLAQRGIRLPAWDRNNPAVVSAWRDASAEFAAGARGNVRVLQGDRVRVSSVWAEVEYPALMANPNVTSITAVDPRTGAEVLLWSR